MIFRQLFDAESSTYTYLLGDPATRAAVLIDPVAEQVERDLQFVRELDLRLTHIFETHVHADHVTGAGLIRERTSCTVVGGPGGASCANVHAKHGDLLKVGGLQFEVLGTPGHTDDSISYRIANLVFTGDALLVRANGRTDFQNGDAGVLYDTITRIFFALPDDTLLYPAHDYLGRTVTSVLEEKRFNPRVSNKSREEFIQLMGALNLPRPKKLDIAVPANRACGAVSRAPFVDVTYAELGGLPTGARLIDVREPDEYDGPLGHLPGTELVPLGTLERASETWPRDRPLLLICRSGKRSVSAAELLSKHGFQTLYNLVGGMTAVREAESGTATSQSGTRP